MRYPTPESRSALDRLLVREGAVARVRSGLPFSTLDEVAAAAGVGRLALARVIGLPATTLARRRNAGAADPGGVGSPGARGPSGGVGPRHDAGRWQSGQPLAQAIRTICSRASHRLNGHPRRWGAAKWNRSSDGFATGFSVSTRPGDSPLPVRARTRSTNCRAGGELPSRLAHRGARIRPHRGGAMLSGKGTLAEWRALEQPGTKGGLPGRQSRRWRAWSCSFISA